MKKNKNCIKYYTDIGGRKENEDNGGFLLRGNALSAVIADGLGGQGDGSAASESVSTYLVNCRPEDMLKSEESAVQAFERANQALMSLQKNRVHMKTTAVYLGLYENRALWAHVGDSRLYHLYNGKLCDYTLDHSLSQIAVTMGEIQRGEISRHPDQNKLYRVMGTENTRPTVHGPSELEKGLHCFLLCTDGLWENLSDAEIEASLRKSRDPEQWLTELRKNMSRTPVKEQDNNTAITIFWEV
ncbi:MAG: hypothetical protein Q4E35_07085 [Eubacteriales bacterium]|nr:hypothetical protein [Eubacteriales bacterium]